MSGSLLFLWDRLCRGGASAMGDKATEDRATPLQLPPTEGKFDGSAKSVHCSHLRSGELSQELG